MTIVVFVHGTGVRQPRYAETLAAVTRAVAAVRPDAVVRGCYWGERFGARLSADGASVPEAARSRGPADSDLAELDASGAGGGGGDLDQDVGSWWVLYLDPIAELRSSTPSTIGELAPPGRESAADVLAERARAGLADPAVRSAADRAGLAGTLEAASAAILTHPDVRLSLDEVGPDGGGGRLLARAIVAEAVRLLTDPPADPPPLDGAARDALVTALAVRIDPDEATRAVPATVTSALVGTGRLAWRLGGARFVERRRAAILDSAHPLPGDVMVYLAHGQGIRDLIAEQVRAAGEPVVLLGHSLGGIACLDLLVEQPGLPVVKLITVGSQAPLLYELGALPSLRPPAGLPTHVPEWVNVYDPRDLLAYVGEVVFPGRVRDVRVDSRQPFPHAHSAYWALEAFPQMLDEELPVGPAAATPPASLS